MRPIERGPWPQDAQGNLVNYAIYQNARGELIERLGQYCSYCEMALPASLAVEHIQPKQPPGHATPIASRVSNWNNFTLSCVNCNSTKGDTEVHLPDYFWPDRDNTLLAFTYTTGGLVTPSLHLTPTEQTFAQNTIQLVGLDKMPSNDSKASDRRWQNRRETWDVAISSRDDYDNLPSPEMARSIVRLAKATGFWSIWVTIFQGYPSILRGLLTEFPGTCQTCFDSNALPLPRPGGQC